MPNPKEDKPSFTASQVGVLVEGLEKKIGTILEIVSPIPDKLEKIDNRLSAVESRLETVEDAVRISFPGIHKRLERLEAQAKP